MKHLFLVYYRMLFKKIHVYILYNVCMLLQLYIYIFFYRGSKLNILNKITFQRMH